MQEIRAKITEKKIEKAQAKFSNKVELSELRKDFLREEQMLKKMDLDRKRYSPFFHLCTITRSVTDSSLSLHEADSHTYEDVSKERLFQHIEQYRKFSHQRQMCSDKEQQYLLVFRGTDRKVYTSMLEELEEADYKMDWWSTAYLRLCKEVGVPEFLLEGKDFDERKKFWVFEK